MSEPDQQGKPTRPGQPTDTPTQVRPTALPSVTARALGFVAIIGSGLAGAFIGYAFTDLQCSGSCATPDAVGALVGAVIGAIGVAVVVVLALRAMGEWRSTPRVNTGPDRPALAPAKRPRVR